jgi:hypothetical protein
MSEFASQKGKIMIALKEIIQKLAPIDLTNEEVEVREDWLGATGDPFQGVSIVDMGEQYDDGTIGTMDVGYICGIIFAKHRNYDAVLADDKIPQWYEQVRRRLADQRLLVPWTGPSAPKEHITIIMPGRTLTDAKKWPNYILRQMVVVSWIRELPVQY